LFFSFFASIDDRHSAVCQKHDQADPDKNRVTAWKVFNADGETIAVVTVRESQIEPLRQNEIWRA